MKMSVSKCISSRFIKFGLCLTGASVLVGCSSPYKYTPRDSARINIVQSVPSTPAPKPVVSAVQSQTQAQVVKVNYYPPAELPRSEELSEPTNQKTQVAVQSKSQAAAINTAKPAQCPDSYKVVSGDSVSSIAFRCRIEPKALAKRNNLRAPYELRVGQTLTLSVNEKLVQPVTSPSAFKKAPAISSKPVAKNDLKALVGSKWSSPVNGSLPRSFIKDGKGLSILEFYGVAGQRINAVSTGKVVYSGNGIINFGWMVVIKHDDDFMSVYAHNSSVLVKEGDRVQKGQFIATMGATGNASKPKLYLEARFKGKKVDIRKVFN